MGKVVNIVRVASSIQRMALTLENTTQYCIYLYIIHYMLNNDYIGRIKEDIERIGHYVNCSIQINLFNS